MCVTVNVTNTEFLTHTGNLHDNTTCLRTRHMEWAAIATFVSVCCAATAGLMHSIQQSRCETISVCCGVCSCQRKVPDSSAKKPEEQVESIESGVT